MALHLDWLTADMHFNHLNILKWRSRGGDVADMNEEIRRRWNAVVGPHHKVGIVGDALMGPRLEGLPLFHGLNGELLLWPGNHDHCWIGNPRRITGARNWPEIYGEYFTLMTDGEYDIEGLPSRVVVSHFPYYGDHTPEERYQKYRPKDNGLWEIHGHIHSEWKTNDRMINVGMDAWGRPVSVKEVADLMSQPPAFRPCPDPGPLANLAS